MEDSFNLFNWLVGVGIVFFVKVREGCWFGMYVEKKYVGVVTLGTWIMDLVTGCDDVTEKQPTKAAYLSCGDNQQN